MPFEVCPEVGGDPIQRDLIVTLDEGHERTGGKQQVLVSTWMRSHLSETAAEQARVSALVRWADRSMCTENPLGDACGGLMNAGADAAHADASGFHDYVVVTERLLLWFDFTTDTNFVNGGGGTLRGAWPLELDGSGQLNFADVQANNWAPNMMVPGTRVPAEDSYAASDFLVQGAGVDSFLTFSHTDDGNVYSQEKDLAAWLSVHQPVRGLEAWDPADPIADAFLVQARGSMARNDSSTTIGAEGTQGRVGVTTNFRIMPCDDHVLVESTLNVEEKQADVVGPVVQYIHAVNVYGERRTALGGRRPGARISFENSDTPVYSARWPLGDNSEYPQSQVLPFYEQYEHAFASGPAHGVRHPSFEILGTRPGSDQADQNRGVGIIPLSGVAQTGVINDYHSLSFPQPNRREDPCIDDDREAECAVPAVNHDACEGDQEACAAWFTLVSAHDIEAFNAAYYTSVNPDAQQDPRFLLPSEDQAPPPGFVRRGDDWFLDGSAPLRSHFAVQFRRPHAPAADDLCGVLEAGTSLPKGQAIHSCNGEYRLEYQTAGNVVLYGPEGVRWATHHYSLNSDSFVMQQDGNAVLYDNGSPLWASGTHGFPGSELVVTNDGRAVLSDRNGQTLWSAP